MSQLKGLLYGIISSSTFGLIPLFALPVLHDGMGLNSVMFYRFGLSALVLGLWLILRGRDLRITLKEFGALFGLGLFYALTALLLTTAYLYIPSGIATTIHFLYPVVVTAVMILFFKDRVSLPVVIATFMAIAGVWLLGSGEGGGAVSLKGLLLVLTTVATYALYIVGVNKSRVHQMDGLKMTFYVLLCCTIIFAINLLIRGEMLDPIADVKTGIYLLLLALIPTLISDFTLILSVQHVGSTTTAVLGCMEPLTAVAMGVIFLHEDLGPAQFGGMIVILAAVSIIILAGSKEVSKLKQLVTVTINRINNRKRDLC